jgi:hypothetical protein
MEKQHHRVGAVRPLDGDPLIDAADADELLLLNALSG